MGTEEFGYSVCKTCNGEGLTFAMSEAGECIWCDKRTREEAEDEATR